MRKYVVLAALTVLSACGLGSHPPEIQTVTIYQPYEQHFVRTLTYNPAAHRMTAKWLGISESYRLGARNFPPVPLDDLRWVQQHGGFDQPMQTLVVSDIVGVRVAVKGQAPIETRFASLWDVNEPEQLKRVQTWYSSVTFSADLYHRGAWHRALYSAVRQRRVREIRFTRHFTARQPTWYTFTVDHNGNAQIVMRRSRTHAERAHGHIDPRALAPIYDAALLLSPQMPVIQANDPPTRVEIITPGRRFTAIGSDDFGLTIFSMRMDQLARDIRWNRRIDWGRNST
jgi:hypothetical protein